MLREADVCDEASRKRSYISGKAQTQDIATHCHIATLPFWNAVEPEISSSTLDQDSALAELRFLSVSAQIREAVIDEILSGAENFSGHEASWPELHLLQKYRYLFTGIWKEARITNENNGLGSKLSSCLNQILLGRVCSMDDVESARVVIPLVFVCESGIQADGEETCKMHKIKACETRISSTYYFKLIAESLRQ
jgi:hypothetical protein